MAEERYISKVRISGENYVIRDKAAFTTADSLRTRVQAVEESIHAMANLTPEKLKEITDNIDLIKQELNDPTIGSWTTIVDKLAGIEGTVKKYIDDAVAGAKAYADNKKSEAIGVAASDATSKANGAKTAAINAAAGDATTKANKALSDAKAYADTKKSEAISTVKSELIGTSTDATTANTIWGAKNYAVKTLKGNEGDGATHETIVGVRKYADEKKQEAITAAATAAADMTNKALAEAKSYANDKKQEAINTAAGDATSKANGAKTAAVTEANNYTNTKISEISRAAFKVSRIEEGGEGILVFSTVGGQQLG